MTRPTEAARMRARVGAFPRARVLVVGDLMVDRYYAGSVRRISPEAPVPVVEVSEELQRFGGAANVAHNLRRLGAAVELCGVVGQDAEGLWLRAELERAGIGVEGLIPDAGRPTILKCRIVAHHQQVVRFDRERGGPHPDEVQRAVEAHLRRVWPRVDAVVVSDYGKGLVQERLMDRLRALNRGRAARPVAVDPKSPEFSLYRRATVVTPNLAEALAAARVGPGQGAAGLEQAGAALSRAAGGAAILITRGEAGMSLFQPGSAPLHIPTVAREVFDVTGAGDTVVGVLALALAVGAPLPEAARLANTAAGIVVGEFGTVPVSREQLHAALAGTGGGRPRSAR
jgi:D-beta-D-heptose 7-phosphate kinase/D-beta-D-heptose 1-phosphate adenosyltransferase